MVGLSWISQFWNALTGTSAPTSNDLIATVLPEDIIVNILMRLPVAEVAKCRRVCKQWQTVSSSPYFVHMHLKQSTPIMFALFGLDRDPEGSYKPGYYFFDEESPKGKKLKRTNIIRRKKKFCPLLRDSCNGLLLFTSGPAETELFIYNPFTREQTILRQLRFYDNQVTHLCGLYFNSLTQEYCLLFYCFLRGNHLQYSSYSIVNGTWTLVGSTFQHYPCSSLPTTTVNGNLHWMVFNIPRNAPCKNSILIFDTKEEKMFTRPHPGGSCKLGANLCSKISSRARLLEMEGQLCFVNICFPGSMIDIWVLEDYSDWAWVRRYQVDLRKYDVSQRYYAPSSVVKIRNNEVLIFSNDGHLFWYHLLRHTVRTIEIPVHHAWLPFPSAMCSYTKSLVSLQNYRHHYFSEL